MPVIVARCGLIALTVGEGQHGLELGDDQGGHPFGLASALAVGVKVFDSLDRGFERLVETGHRIWTWYLKLCEMRGKL